jgi:Right handed beta helix region
MKTILLRLEYRVRVVGACVCLVLLCPVFFVAQADEPAQTSQSRSQLPVQLKQEKALEDLLAAAARSWSAKDFGAVRTSCEKVLAMPSAPPHFQSYAHLRIAQSYLAETNITAAKTEYEKIKSNAAYPEVHRYEAEECLKEIDRAAKGLSARDVTASRTHIPTITVFAVEYFVAPPGNDANSGTREEPFATLEKARDAIRALKTRGALPGPICVSLMPGEYPVERTFELTAADSGTEAAPIVYRADKKGSAVLYGGRRLNGFTPVTDPVVLGRLPTEARGKVFQCDLKMAGITDYSPLTERGYGVKPPPSTLEVFFNGMPLTLARWPNAGFVNGGRIVGPGSKSADKASVFEYLDDRHARWTNAEDGWLFGYFRHGWADRTLKIQNINTAAKQITCGPYNLHGENMEPVKWFNKGRIKYFAFNLLEELDQPGEWYLDRKTGILYCYPPADPAKAVVEIGRLSAPMLTLTGVSHVRLKGLVFDLSRADCMSLKDCEGCLVAGCTVKRFAGSGISIDGGRGDGILGCDLYSLGRGATEVTGGDRKTLTPAQHFVENCQMHSLGRLDHTYVPGILMEGVSIRAAHNCFYDCPSSAIRFDGDDLLMEYNQIERVVLESEDQGGMETFGNPTFRGNVLRYNSFAFIGTGTAMEGSSGRAGIRLDDVISGTLVYGNIFFQASQSFGAININGGRDNIIDNNIFAECEKGITGEYDAKMKQWARLGRDPAFITSKLYLKRYPDLLRLHEQPGLNSAWRNVFWKCGSMFSTYERPSADKFDLLANAEYATNNPGFVDAAKGDFRLKSDAEVFRRIGFRPIPVEEIGLYQDEYRATWPVEVGSGAASW